MKKVYLALFISTFFFILCGDSDNNDSINNSIYKDRMREFVTGISQYAKGIDSEFIIIPQNGQELVTVNGSRNSNPSVDYLNAIDGVGREDLFYGYDNDNVATPQSATDYMTAFLDICELNSVEVLTTDYCSDHSKIDDSYVKNEAKGYISFAAPERDLSVIPDYPLNPNNTNSSDVNDLSEARNFLYLINYDEYSDKADLITALGATNYDVIIMDMFFNNEEYTTAEINSLKIKSSGGTRIILSYMSIGEAENYRYYWQSSWIIGSPSWIIMENPDWPGNYIVQFWQSEWQNIIFGNNDSYLTKIIDAGFDGVYLDIIDAFEYFEK